MWKCVYQLISQLKRGKLINQDINTMMQITMRSHTIAHRIYSGSTTTWAYVHSQKLITELVDFIKYITLIYYRKIHKTLNT